MAYSVAKIRNNKLYFITSQTGANKATVWTSQVKEAARFDTATIAERYLRNSLYNRGDALVVELTE